MADGTYREVADLVVARIRSGELRPHARITLDDLEAAHGKAVVAAAVAWLAAHRWVVRAPGLGVRVAGSPPDLDDAPAAAPTVPADLAARLEQLAARVEELERWRAEHEAAGASADRREREADRRAAAGAVLEPDPAAVTLDDAQARREPDA